AMNSCRALHNPITSSRELCVSGRVKHSGMSLPSLQPLAQFAVRKITRDDHGARQREPRLDGEFGKLAEHILHRPAQIAMHHFAAELGRIDLWQIFYRIALELLEKDALPCDLAERLPVGCA